MLPQRCIIDDVFKPAVVDSDTTLKKRKHFDQQILVTCRQSTLDGIVDEFPSDGRHPVHTIAIIQDTQLSNLDEVLNRLRTDILKALYLIDCKPKLLEKCDSLVTFALTTLVVSHAALQRVPLGIFEMKCLEILQVDFNNLEEIPAELGYLSNLKVFTCDSQRPPLPSLPDSISRLLKLEVLSFSGNQVSDISWVPTLPNLRVLRCSSNRISHLPSQMINLQNLTWLDVSHNRLTQISGSLYPFIQGLHKFKYYNTLLRPISVQCNKLALLAHLKLKQLLMFPEKGKNLERQTTVVLYGEPSSGKSSLVQALKDAKGLCRVDLKQSRSHEFHQFDMSIKTTDSCTLTSRRQTGTPKSDVTSGSASPDRSESTTSFIATVTFSADEMDDYVRDISADLYLLLIDLTTLDHSNGTQHLVTKHINRLQMWLQGLYELSPNTPVLLVGTHADLVRSMSFTDNLSVLDSLLNKGRTHHVRRFQHGSCHYCILCSGKTMATCHFPAQYGFDKFVDVSCNFGDKPANGGQSAYVYECDASKTAEHAKFPHVVGYYELDTRKCFPNSDSRKINTCVEQFKSALLRLSTNTSRTDRVPVNWLAFSRHLSAIQAQQRTTCLPFDDIVSIARSFEITPNQVRLMLQYFHRRGILIYLAHSEFLATLVVVEPSWVYQAIDRLEDWRDPWPTDLNRIIHRLADRDLDRQFQKSTASSVSTGHWLQQALQYFRLFSQMTISSTGEPYFFYHNHLQIGYPSIDVWPDMPELDERQVTCDVGIHTVRPRMFMDLLSALNRQGRHELDIVADPAPVYLSHNIVFITSFDVGRCEECRTVKSRQKYRCQNTSSLSCRYIEGGDMSSVSEVCDEVLHKVNIRQLTHMDTIRIQVCETYL